MNSLNEYKDKLVSQLFDETGSFFAFSSEQLKEGKKEGVKYTHIGQGLITPIDQAKHVFAELERIHSEAIQKDVKTNGAAKIIEREYFNHECQIGSESDAIEALESHAEAFPELFTKEAMKKVFKACFQKACTNDWF